MRVFSQLSCDLRGLRKLEPIGFSCAREEFGTICAQVYGTICSQVYGAICDLWQSVWDHLCPTFLELVVFIITCFVDFVDLLCPGLHLRAKLCPFSLVLG